MSKIECTAVNELIDLVQNKPMGRDSEEELLFSAPPSARQPKGTQPPPLFSTAAPAFAPAPAQPAQPVYRVATTDIAPLPAAYVPAYVAPVPDNARTNPVKRPLFPVEVSSEPTEARATMPVIWTKKPQFEPTPREDDLQTVYVKRQAPVNAMWKQLAIPMGILLVSGIAIGGMITFRGEGGRHKQASHVSAPSPFAAPAIAALPPPAPKVEPIVVAAPVKPKLVDIRLESTPPGATATLLSNGVTTPLGTTPVDASVDPSKAYDVVFALDGRPPKVEHLDPSATQRLEVALDADVVAPKPVATKPAHHHHTKKQAARVAVAHPAKAKQVAAADPAPAPTAARSKQAAALASLGPATAKPAATASGTLSISTTPACAILIDGQNSGLTSPQAAISLPAGHHTVRLIAAPAHINKLVAVDIEPKHTTKLVQDFSK
jgi:hypothetical protein